VEARAGSPLLPLGDWWNGACRAAPDTPATTCDTNCNFGYARGVCARFPAGEGPDAVRFTISSHEGPTVRIYYVVERDHHPFAHGRLEYSLTASAFETPLESGTLMRQAEAYVESYLRRMREA
jgi:hypothetical protein